mgnify:FL=1
MPIMLISGSNDPVSDFGNGMKDLYEMLNKIFLNVQNISIDKDRHEVFSGLKKEDAYNLLRLFLKNIAWEFS